MAGPRLRMVAGPNGSGKSTLLTHLETLSFPLGHVLNPDRLDLEIERSGRFDFRAWGLTPEPSALERFFQAHPLAGNWLGQAILYEAEGLSVRGAYPRGYFAAVLCDFLRRQWVAGGQSFTFETVMSGRDKLDLLRDARARGYRTYLYYVCTDNPLINRERIAVRVSEGGHDVPEAKINSRYVRSLGLLKDVISQANRAYLFDNSGSDHRLVAEFTEARLVQVSADLPRWFVEAVLTKLDPDGRV